MKFKRKYVVFAALTLALGAAVYVNWQFNSFSNQSPKELGAASYVNATVSASADEARQTSVLSGEQQSFFSSERVKRQSTQDKVIDEAKAIIEDESSSEEELSEAQRSAVQMLKNFTIQDSIESLIRAKGFSDCICCISEDGVSVIVPNDELNDGSALIIDDAVTSHYKVDYENISIVGA